MPIFQSEGQVSTILDLMTSSAGIVFTRKVAGEGRTRIPGDSGAGTAMECGVLSADDDVSSKCCSITDMMHQT